MDANVSPDAVESSQRLEGFAQPFGELSPHLIQLLALVGIGVTAVRERGLSIVAVVSDSVREVHDEKFWAFHDDVTEVTREMLVHDAVSVKLARRGHDEVTTRIPLKH